MLIMILLAVALALWIHKHGHEDGSGVAMVVSMIVLGAGVLAWLVPGEHQVLMPALALLMILPGIAAMMWSWRHPVHPNAGTPAARCQRCDAAGAPIPIRQYRVTGLLVWFFLYDDHAYVCTACVPRALARSTAHNLTLGWWSGCSVLAVPGLVVLNALLAVRARHGGTADLDAKVRQVMEPHAGYIAAMLATKDEDTVVEVLSEKIGLGQAEVRRYLSARKAAAIPTARAKKRVDLRS